MVIVSLAIPEQPRESGSPQQWPLPTNFQRAKSQSFPTCPGAKRQLSRSSLASQITQGTQVFFHPLFQTALVGWLGSRRRRTSPAAVERKHKGRDRHADGCENRCDGSSWLTKQGANALSQCGVFMEEPSECLTDSVDLGPEGYSVRGEGFEPCLSFKLDVREYTLELSDSVSNLSWHFSVVCFRQFSMLPGEVSFDRGFSVVDTRQLSQVVCQHISYSHHCLFEPSQLSPGMGDPHGVDRLFINRRLNLFCTLTCAVRHAGEVIEFDVIKVTREGFICLLERFHSGATQTFPRATGVSQHIRSDSVPPARTSRPVLVTPGIGLLPSS